jgi:hypothetical protein
MRQLLRLCCRTVVLSELQTGVSRFRFPSIPIVRKGNFCYTVTHTISFVCLSLLRTSVFLTPFLIAVFRSPVLPSTSTFLTPFLASLLRSAVLPSSSQPPTDTCSVTTSVTGDHLKLRS